MQVCTIINFQHYYIGLHRETFLRCYIQQSCELSAMFNSYNLDGNNIQSMLAMVNNNTLEIDYQQNKQGSCEACKVSSTPVNREKLISESNNDLFIQNSPFAAINRFFTLSYISNPLNTVTDGFLSETDKLGDIR